MPSPHFKSLIIESGICLFHGVPGRDACGGNKTLPRIKRGADAMLRLGALLAAGLWVWGGVARAQNSQPLDDGWEFYRGSLGSLWEIWRGDAASDNVKWTPVALPHCFNARDCVDPDTPYYQGPGWYRTTLRVANPFPNGRSFLHFNGAGQSSKVFVGLEQAGQHTGGYDEWDVDITDAAARAAAHKSFKGAVPVAVRCDNSRDAETIPSDLSDFCRSGGLYRHVSLVYQPAIFLERVHVEPKLADGKATVTIRARLANPAAVGGGVELALSIRDPKGNAVKTAEAKIPGESGEREIAVLEIPGPELWSPSSPALYSCEVILKSPHGEQTLNAKFGIRSVEWVEHGPFKLNGERLLLRGTHYHEDHAGFGAAVPDAVVRKTFQQIKDMGANFVRLGHYQQSPLVLEMCDQLGLLVWEEIPWCRGGLGGEKFRQQCRDMLTNLIGQHYNHPSVILWGLGNENDWPGDFEKFDTKAIRGFMAELNTQAHRLDPSRQTCIRRCDFCKDIVDVYSPSIWAGWYSGRYGEYRSSTEKAVADNPRFFHAEWGADSMAGRHSEEPEKFLGAVATGGGTAETGLAYKAGSGGKARASKDGDWSESYAVNLFDWTLHEQETMPNLTGSAMWVFKDFPTPLRPENPVPRMNQKGVLERDGTAKESYSVFQSYWADKPMIHIYGHTWPVRWGKPGEPREVKVFSNCREVELFVNGVSAGVRRRDPADFPAAGLRWLVKFNEGANTLRAVAATPSGNLSDEFSLSYQTAGWNKPSRFALKQTDAGKGIHTVEVQVVDNHGVPCLDAANAVRFGLTGDGRLIDNLGTARGSRVVQLANGRAQISLHLTGTQAAVSVAADGLPTGFLNVQAE